MLQYCKQSTSDRNHPLPSLSALGRPREGSEGLLLQDLCPQTPLRYSWKWALQTHSCSHFLSVPSGGLNYVEARASTLRLPSPGEDIEGWLSPLLLSLRKNSGCQTGSGLQPGSSLLCDEFTNQESQTLVAPPGMNGAAPGLRRPPRHLPIFCTTCKATTTLRGKWPMGCKPAQVGKRPLQRWSASSNSELRIKFCSEPMFILPKWPWRSRGNCHWGH